MFEGQHSAIPGGHIAHAERDTDVHGGNNERVRVGELQHQRHPRQLRVVQLGPAGGPEGFPAGELRRLPC